MKTTNEEIYDILNKKFPYEHFAFYKESVAIIGADIPSQFYDPERYIEDAFWVAEKLELFCIYNLTRSEHGRYWLITDRFNDVIETCEELPQLICNAIIEIYGDKNER